MNIVDFREFWKVCEACFYEQGFFQCEITNRECDLKFDHEKDESNCPKGRTATLQNLREWDMEEYRKWKNIIIENNDEEIPEDKDCDAHLWSSFECPWFVVNENEAE